MGRSWDGDDNAAAGAIRGLLRNMPGDARKFVLADVEKHADPAAAAEIRDITETDRILGLDKSWRR